MKILEDKQNPLLKRREIKIILDAEKNPTMQEAVKQIVESFKAVEENVAVRQIKGKFGRKTFLVSANIYENKEDKANIEPKSKEKKDAAGKKPEEKKA